MVVRAGYKLVFLLERIGNYRMKEHKIPIRWLASLIITALLAVAALPLLSPIAAEAAPPDQPTNESPANGTTDISLTHNFLSSKFPEAETPETPETPAKVSTHYASQWQITTKSGDYSSPVYDSGVDTSRLIENTMAQGYLNVNTTYFWRVRYQDIYGQWSNWSQETSFKTVISGKPSRPINISPTNGSTHISLTPSMQSSNFVSLDGGATQVASQWQITTKSGDYAIPVYDSGVDTSNLSRITIEQGYLNVNKTYYWRVQHQDSYGKWSGWSLETSFKTIVSGKPSTPSNISPVNGATNTLLTPSMQSSDFVSLNGGAIHAASQWQITIKQGDYTNLSLVFDSGVDTGNKTSIVIPFEALSCNTIYYWRVQHQDSYSNWSNWSAETSFKTVVSGNPSRPINISPANGTTDILITPTLQSSIFVSPDGGATHAASRWQITTTPGNYVSPVFDSGVDTNNKTAVTVPSEWLSYNTTYYWHVKQQDNSGFWSVYSGETSFTTTDVRPPKQPTIVSPSVAATDVSLTLTLQSSDFSGAEAGAMHRASQWQITTKSGDYSSPVYDSGVDTANLTRMTIGQGYLNYSTTYYWHVRYQDSYNNWSAYSSEGSFTTMAMQPPRKPTTVSPSVAAINVSLTPILRSSAFSSIDVGATHIASQWQITTTAGDYSSPVYDSGIDSTDLTKITLVQGYLNYGAIYYWHVRYQDSYGYWSDYSDEASFTTMVVKPPKQPTTVLPSVKATNISLTPILQSSTFSSPDVGATHSASQWQITTESGDYSNPVYDSGVDTVNLTRIAIGAGYLNVKTTYHWRVRYQDNRGIWSDYSSEASFTTISTTKTSFSANDTKSATNTGLPWVWIVLGIVGVMGSLGLIVVSRRK